MDDHLAKEQRNLLEIINKLEAGLVQVGGVAMTALVSFSLPLPLPSYLFNIACQARKCHGQLQKTLLELEDEINKKCNSIYIDEVKCSTLRKSISINCY